MAFPVFELRACVPPHVHYALCMCTFACIIVQCISKLKTLKRFNLSSVNILNKEEMTMGAQVIQAKASRFFPLRTISPDPGEQ